MDKRFDSSLASAGHYQYASYVEHDVAEPLVAQGTNDGEYEVEFDMENGVRYRTWGGYCIAALSCAWCLVPWMASWQTKEMQSQRCRITDRRVIFEKGWLNHSVRYVPLDRIQDINVRQSCIQRCFNVQEMEIQTAGVDAPR